MVHEPPRRLFVALPETSVAVADYLFPGEGTEDCLANIKEIFGVEVEEDQIEDDLEIVASLREVRPAGSSAGKAGGWRIPMVGYALYAVLAAAVSAGVAYMSIGGGEDGEEAWESGAVVLINIPPPHLYSIYKRDRGVIIIFIYVEDEKKLSLICFRDIT